MALPYSQNPLDWLTQAWNITSGQPFDPAREPWLAGPCGRPGGISDRVVAQIAEEEDLAVVRAQSDHGLLDSFERFPHLRGVDDRILRFYRCTPGYSFEVWSRWETPWRYGGALVDALFARRISQLSLPQDPLATARGITSEVILLTRPNGEVAHRVWFRKLRHTGSTIYSGFYSETMLPSGEPCVKVVFPLPHGNATVLMRAHARADGGLRLASQGSQAGEPGFYFIVRDRRGRQWRNYLRSFHEFIDVYVDGDGTLRADHTMHLWNRLVYSLHYKMVPLG
ncbi:hypothetical protein [Oleiharenicola sp. Vm1]|uniref:hypothetical protein n=1 Tax=Oleiharenicola sp. Vm1 TaxID=3398393 RepID=UPI0039F50A0E